MQSQRPKSKPTRKKEGCEFAHNNHTFTVLFYYLGISMWNNNGTHIFIIEMIQMKSFLDEFDILIDSDFLSAVLGHDLDVLLAHWFDESNLVESFLESRQHGQ